MNAAKGSFARGLLIFSAFALAFFMSYGLRAINAVLAPDLVAAFSLSAGDLGAMSSAYFVAFSAMQLPLGIWLDRFGSRRVEASLLLVAALGCGFFALGDQIAHLWLGRALIGAGMAACLMAALKAFRFWFAAHWQQRLAAWILVCGTSGALVSTVPVAMLAQAYGWRMCFVLAAGLLLACSAYLWLALPRDEEEAASKHAATKPQGERDQGYREIFASRFLRGAMPSLVLFQGGFLALQTLWAGPWMTQVLKLNASDTAQALMLFNAALLLGFLWLGWAAPKIASKRLGWAQGDALSGAADLVNRGCDDLLSAIMGLGILVVACRNLNGFHALANRGRLKFSSPLGRSSLHRVEPASIWWGFLFAMGIMAR